MTKVIAIANQKGGVGKTSTTVNLGAGLVRQGYAVLAIDFDPQANLIMALGFKSPDDMEESPGETKGFYNAFRSKRLNK